MADIKNIVFDFGGVLMDWNPRYFYRDYFNDEAEMEYFLSEICNDEWNAENDRGRSFEEGTRILQEKFPQYREAIGLYGEKWPFMLKGEFPESVEMLRRLKGMGYGIYGLTNWSAETIGIAYSRHDFFRLFDGIVVSGEEKVIKPEPGIYKILLERYGLKAEESVFIDDNRANIAAAADLGFMTIHFDSIGNVQQKLSAMLGRQI